MANFAASVLNKVQSMLDAKFQSAEMRYKPAPTLMMLLKNRDFLIEDLKTLRTREDQPTKAYLKNRTSRSLTNARAHDHTGATSDTTEVDIDYTVYTDKFATSLKRGDYNLLETAEIMAHEVENAMINLMEGIETALVSFLDSNKTLVSAPPSGALKRATFNATNDVFEIASADENQFWLIAKSILRQHKYAGGSFDIVADSLLVSKGEFLTQQGQGNSTNLGFQFSGLDVAESIELSDANYLNGLMYMWQSGMAGILDWIPRQNREGWGDMESYNGGYSTIIDPFTGLEFAIHGYSQRADTSGSNGQTQDVTTEFEVSIDLSPQVAPLTTADESPLYAIGIPTS